MWSHSRRVSGSLGDHGSTQANSMTSCLKNGKITLPQRMRHVSTVAPAAQKSSTICVHENLCSVPSISNVLFALLPVNWKPGATLVFAGDMLSSIDRVRLMRASGAAMVHTRNAAADPSAHLPQDSSMLVFRRKTNLGVDLVHAKDKLDARE